MKYNGEQVPDTIDPLLIISAFENYIDDNKVYEYADIMIEKMLSHDFPPIQGFPCVIDERDVYFVDGRKINESDWGKKAWKVTDGHHRSLAAIEARLPYLEVCLDYSTITDEIELKQYDNKSE